MTRSWAARVTSRQQPERGAAVQRTRPEWGPRFGYNRHYHPKLGHTTPTIAQNWLDLHAERSLSSFDQRHLLNLQAQYTRGEGLGGGTLMGGWPGRLLKEWTFVGHVRRRHRPARNAGLPGGRSRNRIHRHHSTRPYRRSHFHHPAQASTSTPPLTARRCSANGEPRAETRSPVPTSSASIASLARTFRPSGRFFLDAKVAATNLLNHPVFTGWNTTVNSTQFGLPLAPNPMRSLETSLRLRF